MKKEIITTGFDFNEIMETIKFIPLSIQKTGDNDYILSNDVVSDSIKSSFKPVFSKNNISIYSNDKGNTKIIKIENISAIDALKCLYEKHKILTILTSEDMKSISVQSIDFINKSYEKIYDEIYDLLKDHIRKDKTICKCENDNLNQKQLDLTSVLNDITDDNISIVKDKIISKSNNEIENLINVFLDMNLYNNNINTIYMHYLFLKSLNPNLNQLFIITSHMQCICYKYIKREENREDKN